MVWNLHERDQILNSPTHSFFPLSIAGTLSYELSSPLLKQQQLQRKVKLNIDAENSTMDIKNTSMSTNITEENTLNTGESPVTIAIFVCLGIIGCLGNGFVLLIFCSSEKLRQSIVNIYLINQSAIDLMASLMIIVTAKGVRKATDLSPDRIEGKFNFDLLLFILEYWGGGRKDAR